MDNKRSSSSSSSEKQVQRRRRRDSSSSKSLSSSLSQQKKKERSPQKAKKEVKNKKRSSSRKKSSSFSRKKDHKKQSKRRSRSISQDKHKKDHKHKQQHHKNSEYHNKHKEQHHHKHNEQHHKHKEDDNNNQKKEYQTSHKNHDDKYGKKFEKRSNSKESKEEEVIEKELPCFIPSGILAKYQNNVNGAVLKYTIPLNAEIPNEKWSLFPFKGNQHFDKIPLRKESAFLIGKDQRVCHILCENPSVSSQHAVIQFRKKKKNELIDGQQIEQVLPYIIDLESTNGTFLNGKQIEPAQYIQLLEQDVLRFGESMREYVLIKEN